MASTGLEVADLKVGWIYDLKKEGLESELQTFRLDRWEHDSNAKMSSAVYARREQLPQQGLPLRQSIILARRF